MADLEPTNVKKTKKPEADVDTSSPISRLSPGSKKHAVLLQHLLARLTLSEKKMAQFYARWNMTEQRIQAYINLPQWEKKLKDMNDSGEPPAAVRIVVPYSYATISTIVTFLAQVFFGRKPMFQLSAYKGENAEAAQMMEKVLQQQADHMRLVSTLFQFFQDTQYYNVGVLKCQWVEEHAIRTVWKEGGQTAGPLNIPGGGKTPVRERRIVYAGNMVESVDPFLFFPDPRVPMHKVNKRGEFVFWRTFLGLHELQLGQAGGSYQYISNIGSLPHNTYQATSNRSLTSGGDATPGSELTVENNVDSFIQIDEGSVIIIPADFGIGESTDPQHWIFTVANKKQIIRAEPLNMDHGMHPVAVSEPYGDGYGFGSAGIADMLGPLQDMMSWLLNSHIDNVRIVLNNTLVVDPSRVEMQDVKKMGPARYIRMKSAALGQDIKGSITQLPVQDVTRSHLADMQIMMQMADTLTGISDNLRGIQEGGGRKTATEVRTATEAGSSRLASLARNISSQGIVDLTTQMAVNTQQLLSEEMYIAVTGDDGKQVPLRVGPESVAGDFSFPVNDGTLPIDRVALLDVWKEIFQIVVQDPELAQRFSKLEIFKHIAELGGAQNIERFEIQVASQEDINAQVDEGTLTPLGANGTQGGGQTPGVVSNPGTRAAGGLT